MVFHRCSASLRHERREALPHTEVLRHFEYCQFLQFTKNVCVMFTDLSRRLAHSLRLENLVDLTSQLPSQCPVDLQVAKIWLRVLNTFVEVENSVDLTFQPPPQCPIDLQGAKNNSEY